MSRCHCTTAKGTQCARAAKKGSFYCAIHQKCSVPVHGSPVASRPRVKKASGTKAPIKTLGSISQARFKKSAVKKTVAKNIPSGDVYVLVQVMQDSGEGPFHKENLQIEGVFASKEEAKKAGLSIIKHWSSSYEEKNGVKFVGDKNINKDHYLDIRKMRFGHLAA